MAAPITKVAAAEAPVESPAGFDTATVQAAKMTENYMRDYYAKQPKVSIKCAEDQWVQSNGYTFIIKGGERVEVPLGIAQMLEEAGRI
jgi:hypothetical protein